MASLTSLTKQSKRKITLNPDTEKAFKKLKSAFTTTPILKHPNPESLFIVEEDASDTGVRAILSQRFGEKLKMHPVAFFSKKLSTAKRNYDVGNRELLQ